MARNFYKSFLVIAVITIFAYHPSFFSFFPGPPGDISRYFLQTRGCNLWELITGQISCNVGIGDTLSFRPILVALLGLQKWLFGAKYVLWVSVSILLHLGVALYLYKFLIRIEDGIFGWLLCLFFSISRMYAPFVLWTHTNSYCIYVMLVLIAISRLYDTTVKGRTSRYDLTMVCISMSIACFLYEIGAVFCLLFFLYLILSDYRKDKNISFFKSQEVFGRSGPDIIV